MAVLKAFGLLAVSGAAIFGITYFLGKIPSILSKKKKRSCCG